MKIMLVIGTLSFGGAERVMANLSNYLSLKHEILLCTLFEREIAYNIEHRVRVKQGLVSNGNKLTALGNIRKTVKEYQPDIILSFLTQINIITIISTLGMHIPVVVSERNDPKYEPQQKVRKLLRRIFYPFAHGYVFQTNEAKNFFPPNIQDRSTVISNPVFIENEIKKVEFSKRKKEFVAVGRLTAQKNYPLLIKAFSKIIKLHPEYKLKIYGVGELEKKLQKMIEEVDAKENIFLMGTSQTLHLDILDSYGFIMTSNHEGLPNALLEAMALGLCCICTDCPCGGPREIIQHGENGILVPVEDEKKLVDAIDQVIRDKSYAEKLGAAAQKSKEKFSIQTIGSQWEEYLKKVYQKNRVTI